MTSITDGSVIIQTSSESVPSTPSWFGEVVLMAAYLRKHGVLTKISERVRFARRRFGHYEVIDFLAVLFGYAIPRPLDPLALFSSADRSARCSLAHALSR